MVVVGTQLVNDATACDRESTARALHVLVHALSHLKNRDIRLYHAAFAQFLVVVGLSVLAALLYLLEGPSGVPRLLQYLAVLVIGLLALRALLRRREHYADLRVAVAFRDAEAAVTALGQLRHHTGDVAPTWSNLLRDPLRSHPKTAARQLVLRHPERLARFGFGKAVLVGVATCLAVTSLEVLLGLLLPPPVTARWAVTMAGAVIRLVAGAVVASEIWRAVHVDYLADRSRSRAWPVAVGVGLGVVLGRLLSSRSAYLAPAMGRDAWLAAGVAAAAWLLFAAWLKWTAVVRFEHDHPDREDRRSYRTGWWAGALVGSWLTAATFDVLERVQAPRLDFLAPGSAVPQPDRGLATAAAAAWGGHLTPTGILVITAMAAVTVAAARHRVRINKEP